MNEWVKRRYQARGTAHVVTCYPPGKISARIRILSRICFVSRSILHYPVGSLDHGPIAGKHSQSNNPF